MAKSATSSGEGQTIEQLQDRYNKLNTKKITAEADLKNAEKQLESLRKEALDKYGTDDLAALKAKLEAMKAENETKRREYQEKLDKIDSDLQTVEQQFAESETLSSVER